MLQKLLQFYIDPFTKSYKFLVYFKILEPFADRILTRRYESAAAKTAQICLSCLPFVRSPG